MIKRRTVFFRRELNRSRLKPTTRSLSIDLHPEPPVQPRVKKLLLRRRKTADTCAVMAVGDDDFDRISAPDKLHLCRGPRIEFAINVGHVVRLVLEEMI